MSDARQSPIPQDRVNENIDQAQRAEDDRRLAAEGERYLHDRGDEDLPGDDGGQPGISDEASSPADGGD
jgi:hypothetical protein